MAEIFNAEEWTQGEMELAFWPVRITSYRVRDEWQCEIVNLCPGAMIARSTGPSREIAVERATAEAEERLNRQRIFAH